MIIIILIVIIIIIVIIIHTRPHTHTHTHTHMEHFSRKSTLTSHLPPSLSGLLPTSSSPVPSPLLLQLDVKERAVLLDNE
jgi:hypothetical protein